MYIGCSYGVVGSYLVRDASVQGDVEADLTLEGLERLNTEVSDGDEDTDDGDDSEHSSCRRTCWLFTQQPNCSLPGGARQLLRLYRVHHRIHAI